MIAIEEILKLLKEESYEELIKELNKSLQEDSNNPMVYFYRFLAFNHDYSHMDFSNMGNEIDFNKSIDLEEDYSFEAEFNFIRILEEYDRKIFVEALRGEENKAILEDRLDRNIFNQKKNLRLLSGYIMNLVDNSSKAYSKDLLSHYAKVYENNPTALAAIKSLISYLEEAILEEEEEIEEAYHADAESESIPDLLDRLIYVTPIVHTQDGDIKTIRQSFLYRLMRASYEVKKRYSDIKNALESHGIKGKYSNKQETFKAGGKTLAKIRCSGKKISVYLALSVSIIQQKPTFHLSDQSYQSGFHDVPVKIAVTSNRTLSHSIELINIMCNNSHLDKKSSWNPIDYTRELILNGEAIFHSIGLYNQEIHKSSSASDDYSSLTDDLLDYCPKIVMEPIDEDFAELDLETLNRCFYDGDIITLNCLKEHGLIKGGNALRIIAKGSLNKRLYIFADAFEPLAVKMLLTTNGSAIEIVRDKYEIIPAPSYYDTIERKPKNNNSSSYSSNSSNSYSSNNSSSYSSNSSNGYSSSYSYIDWEEVCAKIINIFAIVAIPIAFVILLIFYIKYYTLLENASFPINLSFLEDAWSNVPSNHLFWSLGFSLIVLIYILCIRYIIGEDVFLLDEFKGSLISIILVAILVGLGIFSLATLKGNENNQPLSIGIVEKSEGSENTSIIKLELKNNTANSITYVKGYIYGYNDEDAMVLNYALSTYETIESGQSMDWWIRASDNYPLYITKEEELTLTYTIELLSFNDESERRYYGTEEIIIEKEA